MNTPQISLLTIQQLLAHLSKKDRQLVAQTLRDNPDLLLATIQRYQYKLLAAQQQDSFAIARIMREEQKQNLALLKHIEVERVRDELSRF